MELALMSVSLSTDSADVKNQRDVLLRYRGKTRVEVLSSWRQTTLLTSIPLPLGFGQLLGTKGIQHCVCDRWGWQSGIVHFLDDSRVF
ncbi:uncharacterized protein B0P05DRAFT_503865 [Gilbertella persicaria]|uniref:uncharacterized protein n=1 Tax=Gilbertella persicaria TaxID=101096 RepID=UPI00221E6F8E|nr:uncharacterized protein B0P05DRAFT_503865 [Gilbertella persicaria]KAI8091238.1 hypothetical protein B0P05DRAFT_503865 [Gilbertella persicaria]